MEHIDSWKRIPGANMDGKRLLAPRKAKISYGNREIRYITAAAPYQELKMEVEYRNGIRHVKVITPDLPVNIEVEPAYAGIPDMLMWHSV